MSEESTRELATRLVLSIERARNALGDYDFRAVAGDLNLAWHQAKALQARVGTANGESVDVVRGSGG